MCEGAVSLASVYPSQAPVFYMLVPASGISGLGCRTKLYLSVTCHLHRVPRHVERGRYWDRFLVHLSLQSKLGLSLDAWLSLLQESYAAPGLPADRHISVDIKKAA